MAVRPLGLDLRNLLRVCGLRGHRRAGCRLHRDRRRLGHRCRRLRALRRLLEHLEASQVGRARELGWSWQEIADVLGVSRQAVHKKHRRG